jgi:large-conductance mechanosensitive channel
MNMLIRVFLCLFGLFYILEGSCNVFYWKNRESRRLFQLGRLLRAVFGFVIIAVSVLGD